MASLIFKPRKEERLLSGHPWIYRSEVDSYQGKFQDGDVLDIRDHRKRFLGQGYVNQKSQIVCRFLTGTNLRIDADFFRERIQEAIAFREHAVRSTNAYRLIYSESDLLPGLIVDRYDAYLVVQFLTLGMERWREIILDTLMTYIEPEGIYERGDMPVRAHEGLAVVKQQVRGSCPAEVQIEEEGTAYHVNLVEGQKTGFFLDQRENRSLLARYTQGARVLDCFCHTGGFALSAARGGATEVIGIDSAATAISQAQRNAELNNLSDRCQFFEGNVFDQLRVYIEQQNQFDVIVLDPPAFTRGKSSLPGAIRGYKDINLQALRLLNPGGYLLTCSCSYHMPESLFRDILLEAACDAGRTARIVEIRTQANDHPILLAAKETQYLKCIMLQVF